MAAPSPRVVKAKKWIQTKIKNKKTLAAHNLAKISERLLLLMVELKSEDDLLGLIASLPNWL